VCLSSLEILIDDVSDEDEEYVVNICIEVNLLPRVLSWIEDKTKMARAFSTLMDRIHCDLDERIANVELLQVLSRVPKSIEGYIANTDDISFLSDPSAKDPMYIAVLENALKTFNVRSNRLLSSVALQRTAELTLQFRRAFGNFASHQGLMELLDKGKAFLESRLVHDTGDVGTKELYAYCSTSLLLTLVTHSIVKAIQSGCIRGPLEPVQARIFETSELESWLARGEALASKVGVMNSANLHDLRVVSREATLILSLRRAFKLNDRAVQEALDQFSHNVHHAHILPDEVEHARMIVQYQRVLAKLQGCLMERTDAIKNTKVLGPRISTLKTILEEAQSVFAFQPALSKPGASALGNLYICGLEVLTLWQAAVENNWDTTHIFTHGLRQQGEEDVYSNEPLIAEVVKLMQGTNAKIAVQDNVVLRTITGEDDSKSLHVYNHSQSMRVVITTANDIKEENQYEHPPYADKGEGEGVGSAHVPSVRETLMKCHWHDERMPHDVSQHFWNMRNLFITTLFEERLYRLLAQTTITLHNAGDISLSVSYEHTLALAVEEIDQLVPLAEQEAPDFKLSEELLKLYQAFKQLQTCRVHLVQDRRHHLVMALEDLGFLQSKVNNVGWNQHARLVIDHEFHIMEAFAAEHLAMTFLVTGMQLLAQPFPTFLTADEEGAFSLSKHLDPGVAMLKKVKGTSFMCVARPPSRYHHCTVGLADLIIRAVSACIIGGALNAAVTNDFEDQAMDCLEELALNHELDHVQKIFNNLASHSVDPQRSLLSIQQAYAGEGKTKF